VRTCPLLLAALLVSACSPREAPPHREAAAATAAAPTAVAKGVVEAESGLVHVVAPREGLLVGAMAKEGDHVAAGQPLATLEARQSQLVLGATSAQLDAVRAQVEVAAARSQAADRDAARLKRLAGQDAAPRQEAEQAESLAAVARGDYRQAQAALRVAEARRRLDAYEVAVRVVRAPMAGVIVRRDTAPGAYAIGAGPLFLLEPDGRRIVRAELDEAFADRVRPGGAATVSREFQQGQAYPARVVRVADVLAGPAIAGDGAAKADTRVVSVVLSLDGATDLRLGQRVLVRFAP
jgi:HlyD family secretion protein